MNITRAAFERRINDRVHQPHDGANAGVPARELVHRDVFVAVFLISDDLQSKTFGSLIEHALRLLRPLQEIVNLRGSGHLYLQSLPEQKRKFVGELQLTRICNGHSQCGFVRFERDKLVSKH